MASLRRNFVWALTGNVIFALGQFVTLIAITKLGSTAAAGDWTLALGLTGPIFVFAQFKLRQVQTTDASDEYGWGQYVAARIIGVALALVATGAVVALAYRDRTAPVILLVAAAKVFDAGSDLIYGYLQRHERLDRVAVSQICRGVAAMAASCAAQWVTGSVAITAGAGAAIYAIGFAIDAIALARHTGASVAPVWTWAHLRPLLRTTVPLGAVGAIGSLQVNIPRYFLDAHGTRDDLGVWGALSYLLVFGNMVVAAVASAASARLARLALARDVGGFRRLVAILLAIGAAVGVVTVAGAAVIGAPVLRLLYSDAVAAQVDVLVWLALASGLLYAYHFLGTALDALRQFRVQPWIHLCTALAITTACAALVPTYGAHGAAWATVIGYGLECLLYTTAVMIPLRRLTGVPS